MRGLTISQPLMLIVGMALLGQCAYLASAKVTHFGVMLPAVVGLIMVFIGVAGRRWTAWLHAVQGRLTAWRVMLGLFILWLMSVAVFFGVLYTATQRPLIAFEPAVIIVLGAGTPGGRPSPILAKRLDLALEMARIDPAALVVTSGGVDFSETVSEGEAMAAYLHARGLESRRTLVEGQSSSTQENLIFSKRLLQNVGIKSDAPMLLVTSDFHTLRAERIARKAGWSNFYTAGAPTPLYMRYNAWLREYFAWISGWLLREY